MKFVRSSIINFTNRGWYILSEEQELIRYAKEIYSNQNYSKKTKLNDFENGYYWHINNFRDFYKLIDDLKKIPRDLQSRNLDELINLFSIIIEEKVELYLCKNNERTKERHFAWFIGGEYQSIVVNCDFLHDIDYMSISLTHELIHYFQQGMPLNIDIEDSIVMDVINRETYSNLKGIDLQCELEAQTFENYPNFIQEYKKDKNNFKISKERLSTIQWITQNKKLPNYPIDSYPTTSLINFRGKKSIYFDQNLNNKSKSSEDDQWGCLISLGIVTLIQPWLIIFTFPVFVIFKHIL